MKLGIKMLIHNKDDIKFVTEIPCSLGHTVEEDKKLKKIIIIIKMSSRNIIVYKKFPTFQNSILLKFAFPPTIQKAYTTLRTRKL